MALKSNSFEFSSKSEVQFVMSLQALDATRDPQICRICFVVEHLKYHSTCARPLASIFEKFVICIILFYVFIFHLSIFL